MSFIRVRTIKGKQYAYLEMRWREGKKVRSKSLYLGGGQKGIDWKATLDPKKANEGMMPPEPDTAPQAAPATPAAPEVEAPSTEAPGDPGGQENGPGDTEAGES